MFGPVVSAKWLHEHRDEPDLVVLDASMENNVAGEKPRYPHQQIEGARHFDLDGKFSDPASDLPHMLPEADYFQAAARKLGISRTSRIVVYDNLGVYSSPRIWWMFKAMGHEEVAVLDGGLPAWVEEGYPTVPAHAVAAEEGDFEASFRPDLVKEASAVKSNIDTQNAVVIDARSEGRFKGTAPEPRKNLRGGHIPHSLNLPYGKVLRAGKFLPQPELSQLFQDLELKDKPLIFSCGSGLTAAIILVAADLVTENPKSIYDGSWAEWGQLEDCPVHTNP